MIIETKKGFKDVDTKLHELSVKKVGKSSSLPSLDIRKAYDDRLKIINNDKIKLK